MAKKDDATAFRRKAKQRGKKTEQYIKKMHAEWDKKKKDIWG